MDRKRLYMGSFFDHFTIIYDLRQQGKVRHKLMDILFIVVAATVCNCNEWEEIKEWAIAKEEWLRQYLEMKRFYNIEHLRKGMDV